MLTPSPALSTAVSRVSNSNDPLPEPFLSEARSYLMALETEFTPIDSTIRNMDAAQEMIDEEGDPQGSQSLRALAAERQVEYQELHQRCESLLPEIELYRIITAPLRNVPDEILMAIVHHLIDPNLRIPPVLRNDYRQTQDADLRWCLCRVFSRLRRLILGTPWFWNKVIVNFGSGYTQQRQVVQELIERAGSLPLHLHISASGDAITAAGSNPIVDIIIPNSKHLATLTMFINGTRSEEQAFWDLFFSQNPGSMPHLESIKLDTRSYRPNKPLTVFNGAKALQKVSLLIREFSPFVPCIPWVQLTNCKFRNTMGTATALAFLSKCVSLVSCNLAIRVESNNGDSSDATLVYHEPLALPFLTDLKLELEPFETNCLLLKKLILPRLENFQLKGPWKREYTPAITLSGALKTIYLASRSSFPLGALSEILDSSPYLTTLNVPNAIFTSVELNRLARGELGPSLTILHCTVECVADLDEIINSIKERNTGDRKLVRSSVYVKTEELGDGDLLAFCEAQRRACAMRAGVSIDQ